MEGGEVMTTFGDFGNYVNGLPVVPMKFSLH